MFPNRGCNMASHNLSIDLICAFAIADLHRLFEPHVKELCQCLLLDRYVHAHRLVVVCCFEFIGNLLAGFTIEIFALAPAVHPTQVHNSAPTPIFAPMDGPLAMPASLAHSLPLPRYGSHDLG